MADLSLTSILSNISDYTNDAVIITDAEPIDEPGPVIVYVNPTFTHNTGYHASDVIGKSPRLLQGPNTSPSARREIRDALKAWRPIVTELLNYKKDGTPFWSEMSIVPIADDAGIYRYWLSVQRNTTEQRQQQRDLSFRSLAMDASTTAIAVCVLEGDSPKVVYGNRPFTTMLGDADVSGSAFLNLFEGRRRQETIEALKAALTEGRVHISEELISPPGGGQLFARISIEPVPCDLAGAPMLMISVRDKTEEQARKEEIAQAQRLRAIGQLTGGVAHDFNNLLTIVTHCSDILLAQKDLSEEAQSLVRTIAETADRAASLTAQLLSFGRRRPLESQDIDLGPFLERLQSVLRRVIPATIAVQLRMEPGLAHLKADPAQLETALLNLAINARDAIALHGVIRLVAANQTIKAGDKGHGAVPPGDYVRLAVTDNGPGMSEEVRQRAFEPFFTTKEVGLGSGLGLSMVYGFAHQSGGHVRIVSSPGAGATVELLLPQSKDGPKASPAAPAALAAAEEAVDFGSVAVLVVEDTPEVLEQVIRLIRGLGCRTYAASNGPEALSILQAHKEVDLLFTDVVMAGGINGVVLAQEARSRKPDLKVLFTSGYSEEDPEVMRVLSDGAPLLKKPYRSDDLARALKQAVSGR